MLTPIDLETAIYNKYLPEPVVIIVTWDESNKRCNAMVSSWTSKVSSDPFMLTIPLWKKGYSHKLALKEKEMVVAVPGNSLIEAVKIFGTCHGNIKDKFALSNVSTSKAKYVKPALISDALLNFECKVDNVFDVGDHYLFCVKILAQYQNVELPLEKPLQNYGFTDDYAEIW